MARARSIPSTSTLMLPSGSFRDCTTLATQPIVKMSSGRGSSIDASCWAARKIFLSRASACSSARVDEGRPITNGIIMCGKTTTSRKGTTGSVSYWSIRSLKERLSRLLDDGNRLLLRLYHLARDHALPNLLLTGQRVHQVEHDVLDDHPQPARADLPAERGFGDRFERVFREPQLDVLVLEQALVLTRDRVSGLSEDLDERGLVKFVQGADDRQAPDELGDEAVLDQVFRLELIDEDGRVLDRRLHVGPEPHRLLPEAPGDLLVEADERAAADEEDVGRVDLEEF